MTKLNPIVHEYSYSPQLLFAVTYFKPDTLPERVFRAKFIVINGDVWTSELADQNSLRFQHKSRDYRERINLVIRRSDLRESYEGSEVLALDGYFITEIFYTKSNSKTNLFLFLTDRTEATISLFILIFISIHIEVLYRLETL